MLGSLLQFEWIPMIDVTIWKFRQHPSHRLPGKWKLNKLNVLLLPRHKHQSTYCHICGHLSVNRICLVKNWYASSFLLCSADEKSTPVDTAVLLLVAESAGMHPHLYPSGWHTPATVSQRVLWFLLLLVTKSVVFPLFCAARFHQ